MAKALSKAQVNHLRRLIGWVRCDIPPSPDEVVSIVKIIAPAIDSEHAKEKMVEWHREAESVPKYIRAALKSLEPIVKESQGEIVDAEVAGLPAKRRSRTKQQVSQLAAPNYGVMVQSDGSRWRWDGSRWHRA